MYCSHGHLADSCEACALVQALERGQRLSTPPPTRVVERVRVDDATLLELGAGLTTLVNAGDLIPLGLEDRPRRKVAPAPRKRAAAPPSA